MTATEGVSEAQREGGGNGKEGTTEGGREVVRERERPGQVRSYCCYCAVTLFIVHSCMERETVSEREGRESE